MTEKRLLHINDVVMKTSDVTAMPAQFCEFRPEIFHSLVFEPHVSKGLSVGCRAVFLCFVLFFNKFWSLLYFFGSPDRSYLSRKKVEGRNSMRRLVHELHRVQK